MIFPQVTRSFGDLYLKNAAYAINNPISEFYLEEPICGPILSSVPSFLIRDIGPNDSFLVVASDGLWKILSNYEVVQFVNDNRRKNVSVLFFSIIKEYISSLTMCYKYNIEDCKAIGGESNETSRRDA